MSMEALFKHIEGSYKAHLSSKLRITTKKGNLIIKKKSKIRAGNNCLSKTAKTENSTWLRSF